MFWGASIPPTIFVNSSNEYELQDLTKESEKELEQTSVELSKKNENQKKLEHTFKE